LEHFIWAFWITIKNFYIRLACSGIDVPEIKEGLGKFKAFIES
jgi:hypothetical protein